MTTATTTTKEIVQKRAATSATLRRSDVEIGSIGGSGADRSAYLTVSGAARMLNCSITTVQRMARKGTLAHIMDESGIRRYAVSDVEAMKIAHAETKKTTRTIRATMPWDPDRLTGHVSAEVFRMFEEGKSPIEVTISLQLAPSAVRRLHNEWIQMKDMVCLDVSQYRTVRSILLTFDAFEFAEGDTTVPLADDLVRAVCKLPSIVARRDALLCEVCVATEAKTPARATRCKAHGKLAR